MRDTLRAPGWLVRNLLVVGGPKLGCSQLWGDRSGRHQPTLVEAVIADTVIYGETGEPDEKKDERQMGREHQYLRSGPRGRRL